MRWAHSATIAMVIPFTMHGQEGMHQFQHKVQLKVSFYSTQWQIFKISDDIFLIHMILTSPKLYLHFLVKRDPTFPVHTP